MAFTILDLGELMNFPLYNISISQANSSGMTAFVPLKTILGLSVRNNEPTMVQLVSGVTERMRRYRLNVKFVTGPAFELQYTE